MAKGTCSIEGCQKPVKYNGLCSMHAERLRTTGSLERPGKAERFWRKVDVRGPDECWPCKRRDPSHGYARVQIDGVKDYAHRVAYKLTHGPVPDGLVIDHTCHNADPDCLGESECMHRACCNPAHLRAATTAQNVSAGARGRRRGCCLRGHPWTAESTYIVPRTGHRRCRICRRLIRKGR